MPVKKNGRYLVERRVGAAISVTEFYRDFNLDKEENPAPGYRQSVWAWMNCLFHRWQCFRCESVSAAWDLSKKIKIIIGSIKRHLT